jgi:hypothetical protein
MPASDVSRLAFYGFRKAFPRFAFRKGRNQAGAFDPGYFSSRKDKKTSSSQMEGGKRKAVQGNP